MNRRSRAWLFLRAPFEGIPPVALVLFAVGAAFSFLFFNQRDLFHTVVSSYAYLDGHVVDFYDFNRTVVEGNDYLPAIYVIFAIWMSPFKLFGGMTPDALRPDLIISPMELFWAKLLLVLVFLVTFYLISAIAKHVFADSDETQRMVRAAYLLSPLVVFAVFTFGGYDIFSVVFTLLGVLMYLRRRSFWFVFWFSIAISFKYFALFLFVPLAIYYFKRPLRILLALAGGAAFTVLELGSYWHNSAFHRTAFTLAEGRARAGSPQLVTVMGVLFLVLCLLAFLYGRRREDLAIPLIVIWAAGYAIIFLAVSWHPQWTVILAPVFALSLGLMKRPGLFLVWESVAFVVFTVYVTTSYVENVDAVMITQGILSQLLGDPTLLQGDILGGPFLRIGPALLALFFISPLVWIAAERAAGLAGAIARVPHPGVWILRAVTVPLALTLPSLALTLVPRDAAAEFLAASTIDSKAPLPDAPTSSIGR